MEDGLPFVVETEVLSVNVLGITFRVRARENKTDVVLESGKVKLDLNRSWDRVLEMVPGDQIHYSALADELEKTQIEEDKGMDWMEGDRKSTRLNSSHVAISYAVFCL